MRRAGDLGGRTAVVTGGSSGVGLAVARALAAAGATVWIAGRREAALAAAAEGTTLRPVAADVTDEASVRALFRATGPVQIVVANAGEGRSAPFRRTSLADWNAMIAVNLTGAFLTFREGLAAMPPGYGRLIAIASTAGLKGDRYVAAYAAAKHGVVGLVRALAKEVAEDLISVNALCPGYVETPMTERTVANIAERTGVTPEAARARLVATNPAGRLVAPEEVAEAVLWLCSERAAMINGQAIALSGGEV